MTKDTHHSYAANKQMFLLSIRSRIVAAATQVLGLPSLDAPATKNCYPQDTPKDALNKQKYISKVSSLIVQDFLTDNKSHELIIRSILDEQDREQLSRNEITIDGRFKCRHAGCDKTFKYDFV